jgi:hypothetical protein
MMNCRGVGELGVWQLLKKFGRLMALFVAAATALTGLALLFPQLVPSAFGLPFVTGRYALVGIYLLYCAFLITR